MRTMIVLDEALLAKLRELTGIQETSALVREALKAWVERENARRLVLLGGTEPELEAPTRRRSPRR